MLTVEREFCTAGPTESVCIGIAGRTFRAFHGNARLYGNKLITARLAALKKGKKAFVTRDAA